MVNMIDSVVFHKTVKGTSHIKSDKPCQDFSGIYQDEVIQIVVVSDGHGGNTYFRSDIGAKIATEITIQILRDFARCVQQDTFKGKSFSITAQPQKNPFIDADGHKLRFEELNDSQKKLAIQAQSFLESEGKNPQEQEIVKDLLSTIYRQWIYEINQDVKHNPFDKNERKILKGLGVEGAYGCTLLAFLQTKDYWLSFHIGDGKITCCDQSLTWYNPVPDDCNCFLNYTTSLCDSNPLIEFRYAFNGIDKRPLAVMLCSDGLDGSLRSDDNLQDFYEQIIGLCLDGDNVEVELESYLPELSTSGNKDDISLAGIVSLSDIDKSLLKNRMELKSRERNIKSDYQTKKTEIDSINSKIEVLKLKYDRLKDARFNKQTDLDELRSTLKSKEQEVSELDKSVETLRKEIETLKSELKQKTADFDNWKFTIKNEMADLETLQNRADANDIDKQDNNYVNW